MNSVLAWLAAALLLVVIGAASCRPNDPLEPKTPPNSPLPDIDRPVDPPEAPLPKLPSPDPDGGAVLEGPGHRTGGGAARPDERGGPLPVAKP